MLFMRYTITLIILLLISQYLLSQGEKLEVEGAITIGNSEVSNPIPGTIRWTGTDFEGWNGSCWISLTNGQTCPASPTDGDGNIYQTVEICNQEWLLTDLATTTCNDGTPIPLVTSDVAWEGLTTGAYCWYENDEASQLANGYGALYNWYIIDECNICPVGWHVPTDAEWIELTECLAGAPIDPNQTGATNDGVGGMLKETGLVHWNSPNVDANNSSGFTALPGGFRDNTAIFGTFSDLGGGGNWWASDDSPNGAWERGISSQSSFIFRFPRDKGWGFSVRCTKD